MISIIVPVYNTERYLSQSIESVISQSFSDWELVLVDDGSTDSSGKVCEKYAAGDNRIKTIHKNNGGLSSARNAGLREATGDYILFLDSDDLLLPEALKNLWEVRQQTGGDIICGKYIKFNDGRGIPVIEETIKPDRTEIKAYTPKEAVREVLYQKTIDNSVAAKLYASFLFNDVKFEEGLYYEDLDIFYRLFFKAGLIVNTNIPVYLYRQHDSSYIHTFSIGREDMLTVTSRIVDFMSQHSPELLPAAKSRQLSANFNMLLLLAAHKKELNGKDREDAKNIAVECWETIKKLRKDCLRDKEVRLKNKAGILLGYIGGRKFLEQAGKLFY